MRELINLRKKREKHFLNPDGTITAYVYDRDIHYLKNGVYEEIDNTLVDKGEYFENKSNSFHALFMKNSNDLVNVKKDAHYLKMYLNSEDTLKLDKSDENINYKNLKNNIDFNYKMLSSKLKESIILNCRETVPEILEFFVDTDLKLELKENKTILAKYTEEVVFTIDSPFMVDARGNRNYCVDYEILEISNGYLLKVILDVEWLKDKDTVFPVIVDPTIINGTAENVYDTFISSKESTTTKNSKEYLELGVTNDDIKRILLKFTLPEIGTGYDIIEAKGYLTSSLNDIQTTLWVQQVFTNVHEITSDWDETTATWAMMNDKYNPLIEDSFVPAKTHAESANTLVVNEFNITNLVKRWYAGKPNYGVMLKWNNEVYNEEFDYYEFYSKTYDVNNSVAYRAYMTITYRNQNGLEDYMTYSTQDYTEGTVYINNLTGNLTARFDLNQTIGGKFPISLSILCNTNDVILNNNYGYGKGLKLSLHETIKEVIIDNNCYLEFLDGDGTIHYFFFYDNKYEDEDGLGLTATLIENNYVLEDKNGTKFTFIKTGDIWYLGNIIDSESNQIVINYDDFNRIIKVVDANNAEINVTYEENKMIIISDNSTSTINYTDSKISNIITKMGTTYFLYNTNGLIEKIIDVNGLGYKYEYYNISPYKISKITELGLNDAIGKTLNFEYGFCVTRIIDNKGRCNTYTFNVRGNTIGITNLIDENNLNEAYGKSMYYHNIDSNLEQGFVNRAMNKLNQEVLPIKFTKNLVSNSSFENECTNRSDECSNTGSYSYKIVGSSIMEFIISPSKYYTFSGYFKNSEKIILKSYVTGVEGMSYNDDIEIPANDEFTRYDFSFYANDTRSIFGIEIYVDNNSNAYMDDIQLEEGKIANYYNMIENADFYNNFTNWNVNSSDEEGNDLTNQNEIVTLDCGTKVAKLIGGPTINTTLSQFINVSGLKGDIYNLSFWYKNTGIVSTYEGNYASALISFNYPEDFEGNGEPWMDNLNYHSTEWQFYSGIFVAEEDYDGLYVNLLYLGNANTLSITNVVLSKDIEHDANGYDYETGNLTSYRNMNGSNSEFKYDKNNQLTSIFDPKGNNFKFEYDNNKETRVLKGISPSGISNEIKYDSFGNPIKTIINNVNPDNGVLEGKKYSIRAKGTDKYLDVDYSSNLIKVKENICNTDYFEVTKSGDYFRFNIGQKQLSVQESNITLIKDVTDTSLFKLVQNSNGSYLIVPKINEELCLSVSTADVLVTKSKDGEDYTEQFYFEDISSLQFIETKVEYTDDGKFVTKSIDALGRNITYDVNQINGLINKITDSDGNETDYTYNDKEQITRVVRDDRVANYEYNGQSLLSKISANNIEYNFTYDDFLNIKDIKVNDTILSTNLYDENNGNLVSKIYGNGSVESYSYNDLDMVTTITNDTNTYNYTYDSLGNLSEIISLDENHKYYYDLSRRISKYEFVEDEYFRDKQFTIDYDYDVNNNVISKKYKLKDNTNQIESTNNIIYEYNNENIVTKIIIENNNLNYIYDSLGRVMSKSLNDNNTIEYQYYNAGNKSSNLIKSIKINGNLYEYKYDNLGNIININLNNHLLNHYDYNEHQELIQEDNFSLNKTFKYIYDNNGNILKTLEYEYGTNKLLNCDNYEYQNIIWEDQLTKFNEDVITYDNVGNPLTIGDKVLTWKNGKDLSTYNDTNANLNITYKYNIDGIRTSKIINNITTNYYTENNHIIFETTNEDMIYYLRDDCNNLIGLKYNDSSYYYLKNSHEDIIGLLDNDNNLIATYEYDSWGNILSIKDNAGDEITDSAHIAFKNPFRYRSYYYDKETQLYYLNSRYYNPKWKRFINADSIIKSENNIYNLFMYCRNNPIMYIDPNGKISGIAGGIALASNPAGWAVAAIIAVGIAYYATGANEMLTDVLSGIDFSNNDNRQNSQKRKNNEKKTHYVYTLRNEMGIVQYVGRTVNPKERFSKHKTIKEKADLIPHIEYQGMDYIQARRVEEFLILKYNTINRGNYMNNQIHGINPKVSDYDYHMKMAEAVIGEETYVGGYKWTEK